MAKAWTWCSNGMFLKLTHVGNARLLRLSRLKPGIQLWMRHVPVLHFDLNDDNINALLRPFLLSSLSKESPFPTFLQIVKVLSLSSWFNVCIHNLIAWGLGLGPTNFPISSWSYIAIRASSLSVLTWNLNASFLTKNPLKPHSRLGGRTSPLCPLDGFRSPSEIWSLASASTSITTSAISSSWRRAYHAIQPPFSSIFGSNVWPPPDLTFSANAAMVICSRSKQSL